MVSISKEVMISQNLEPVYAMAEQYPKFIGFYKTKEIVHSDENSSRVKIESKFCGLKFSWEGKGIKEKNRKIEWIQSKGLLNGMRAEWLFLKSEDKSTRVVLTVTYSSPVLFWEEVASFLFIRRTVPKILSCLKAACE